MPIFALAAAVVAFLAIIDVTHAELLWWWLMFIALHFAFGGIPIPTLPQRRKNPPN